MMYSSDVHHSCLSSLLYKVMCYLGHLLLRMCLRISYFYFIESESGSSVGIGTDYGLDDPGRSYPGVARFPPSWPALGPTQPPAQWVPVLCRG